LEVGCSPSAAIHSLGKAHFRVGIDPLADEWTSLYENSTCHVQGMGEHLPLKDESFDIVLCINVLDHVQNPSATLKEIRRCLRKGGTLVLWLQTFSSFGVIRRALGLIDAPHPHHFSGVDVAFMLHEIGYSVDYHRCGRVSFGSTISVIKEGLIISGLKSLFANLLLGLHESSYICS
jgi:SAM-dependent methyltransferase